MKNHPGWGDFCWADSADSWALDIADNCGAMEDMPIDIGDKAINE